LPDKVHLRGKSRFKV